MLVKNKVKFVLRIFLLYNNSAIKSGCDHRRLRLMLATSPVTRKMITFIGGKQRCKQNALRREKQSDEKGKSDAIACCHYSRTSNNLHLGLFSCFYF